jgi:hypothetical protein
MVFLNGLRENNPLAEASELNLPQIMAVTVKFKFNNLVKATLLRLNFSNPLLEAFNYLGNTLLDYKLLVQGIELKILCQNTVFNVLRNDQGLVLLKNGVFTAIHLIGHRLINVEEVASTFMTVAAESIFHHFLLGSNGDSVVIKLPPELL